MRAEFANGSRSRWGVRRGAAARLAIFRRAFLRLRWCRVRFAPDSVPKMAVFDGNPPLSLGFASRLLAVRDSDQSRCEGCMWDCPLGFALAVL